MRRSSLAMLPCIVVGIAGAGNLVRGWIDPQEALFLLIIAVGLCVCGVTGHLADQQIRMARDRDAVIATAYTELQMIRADTRRSVLLELEQLGLLRCVVGETSAVPSSPRRPGQQAYGDRWVSPFN